MSSHPTARPPSPLLLPPNPPGAQPEPDATLRVYWRTEMEGMALFRCCDRHSFWKWGTFRHFCMGVGQVTWTAVKDHWHTFRYIPSSVSEFPTKPKQAGLLNPHPSCKEQIWPLPAFPEKEAMNSGKEQAPGEGQQISHRDKKPMPSLLVPMQKASSS